MSIALSAPFSLITASRYARPADGAAIIPDVYGDFSSGGLRGPIPAVLVDTTNFIYAAAAHAVQSIDQVWVDDVLQTATVDYTANVSYDLESQGTIAVIDFVSQPSGEVSWRGVGKQSGGSLISGAIDQIEDLLTTRAGGVSGDFNSAALARAKAVVASEGYTPAWVIQDTRQIGEWLTEMLFNVMGRYRVAGDGKLEFFIDDGSTPFPLDCHIVASRDCVDGEEGVEFEADYQHVVNALTIFYQYSWSKGEASTVDTSREASVSKNAYGETRKIVTLRGLRASADIATWATVVFERSDYRNRVEGARVTFSVDGARCAHVTPGDFVSFSWDWGPTRESNSQYRNEILQVLTVQHQPGPGRLKTTITALDTGYYLTADPYFDGGTSLGVFQWNLFQSDIFQTDESDGSMFDADVYFGGNRSTVLQP